jgi:hypothetical protein
MSGHITAEAPPRPTAVKVAVPVLVATGALLAGLSAWSLYYLPAAEDDGRVQSLLVIAGFSIFWNYGLYQVWTGGRIAVRLASLATVLVPGMSLVVFMIAGVMNGHNSGYTRYYRDLSMYWWLFAAACVCILAVGIGLMRPAVRAWSHTLDPPPSTNMEAATILATGPAPGGMGIGATPVGMGIGAVPVGLGAGIPVPVAEAGTSGTKSLTIDLGKMLLDQARMRINCFGLAMGLFIVFGLIMGTRALVKEGDSTELALYAIAVTIVALVLAVSVLRFRRRLGPGSVLTIDQRGITWQNGVERALISWDAMAGVGISYHLRLTKHGRKVHMPQLDIFEQASRPAERWPDLATRRRKERPPRSGLPDQRYRLMLPADHQVHAQIEVAVKRHRPALWLRWYERSRSDTPWFLR